MLFGLISVAAAWGLTVEWRLRRDAARRAAGDPRCGHCGYLLIGLTARRCPECGSDLRWVGVDGG